MTRKRLAASKLSRLMEEIYEGVWQWDEDNEDSMMDLEDIVYNVETLAKMIDRRKGRNILRHLVLLRKELLRVYEDMKDNKYVDTDRARDILRDMEDEFYEYEAARNARVAEKVRLARRLVRMAKGLMAGCEKLPKGPMRDNCEKKKKDKKASRMRRSQEEITWDDLDDIIDECAKSLKKRGVGISGRMEKELEDSLVELLTHWHVNIVDRRDKTASRNRQADSRHNNVLWSIQKATEKVKNNKDWL
jgi:NTP pyrophosphatase (non-canonical NTP hydrolase)